MSMLRQWVARMRAPALTIAAIVGTVVIGGFAFTDIPQRLGLVAASSEDADDHGDHDDHDHDGDDHEGHDHGHEGHSEENTIELSEQARANLRLEVQPVKVGRFNEYIEVPATVANWPGRTHISITSPLTGVINAIYVSRGEMVRTGAPLFLLRLTHQDLVVTQERFLTSLGQLDVEEREITRLTTIAKSGAVAGKTLINREYERDKLMAGIRAARQLLLLHGLSDQQIQRIEQERVLIREMTVYAPRLHADRSIHHETTGQPGANLTGDNGERFASMVQPPPAHPKHIDAEFLITELTVSRGASVETGQMLGQLSDYSQVLIEGFAYQRDGEALKKAANAKLDVQAVMESANGANTLTDGLKIIYIGNEVNQRSRALPFFVSLTNVVERSEKIGPQQYVSWRYKPGQRLRLRIPVSGFDNAIIVPKDAIAEEGPERYVFVQNNDHFDRVSVHVLAGDSINVAIANDGQVWPGQSIAVSGAHQLQMALKNKSGGAIDPHAGHNH